MAYNAMDDSGPAGIKAVGGDTCVPERWQLELGEPALRFLPEMPGAETQ